MELIALKTVFTGCLLIEVAWTIDVWCFQISWNYRDNDRRICTVLTGIALKIVFTGCLLIGIAWTIDVWCFQLLRIVQTNDIEDCLLIWTVMKKKSHGCLFIAVARTIGFGWCTWIKIVGTTVFGDGPLIFRTIEFYRAPLFENRQLLLCRVQLIELVSTTTIPSYHCLSHTTEKFPVHPTIWKVLFTKFQLIDGLRNPLSGQCQLIDNHRNQLSGQFKLIDSHRHQQFGQFQWKDNRLIKLSGQFQLIDSLLNQLQTW